MPREPRSARRSTGGSWSPGRPVSRRRSWTACSGVVSGAGSADASTCVRSRSRPWSIRPGRSPLSSAAERHGVPVASPHHALDDALVTAQLLLVVAARLRADRPRRHPRPPAEPLRRDVGCDAGRASVPRLGVTTRRTAGPANVGSGPASGSNTSCPKMRSAGARCPRNRRRRDRGHRSRSVPGREGSRSGDQGGPQADRRCRRRVHVLPVRLGHRPDHGEGDPGGALGEHREQGVPARLRLDGQPVHRPARQLHRLRSRGARAGRPSGARHVQRPSVGHEDRTGLLHAVPRARGGGRRRRVPDVRLQGEPEAPALRVRAGDRTPPPRRLRAGDDVAEGRRRRQADRRGHDEAVLLPHRPVLRAPAADPQGHGVRARDGPRHDPGGPRGRTRAARAELHVRPRRGDGGPAHHLPADLPPGRTRARGVRMLHAEAVHGRVGERMPPQHLVVARRREHVLARR